MRRFGGLSLAAVLTASGLWSGCSVFEDLGLIDPPADAGTVPRPDGGAARSDAGAPVPVECGSITYFGECSGDVLTYCDESRHELAVLDCAAAQPDLLGFTCVLVNDSYGHDCGARIGDACSFEGPSGVLLTLCEGADSGCVDSGEGYTCVSGAGLCTPADEGTCRGDVLIQSCIADRQGQPGGIDCAGYGGRCEAGTCVDFPAGAACIDGFATCAEGLVCTGGVCAPAGGCTHPGGLVIRTDADVAAFLASGCTAIGGELLITADVTSLSGMRNLASVGGHLRIQETTVLGNVIGLQSLTTVGGELQIIDNDALSSLSSLRNLRTVHDNVAIGFNAALPDLNGLQMMRPLAALLSISNNAALTTLNGLQGITQVVAVDIRNNASLGNVHGLGNLATVTGSMFIVDNPALEGLDGLERLRTVGGGLSISANARLTDTSQLANLQSVTLDLNFATNTSVTQLYFDSLTSVQNLSFLGNTSLPSCQVDALSARLMSGGWRGRLSNVGNGTGSCP